jgi:hypothetical protein
LTVTVLFLWGTLSDERTDLSFVYAAGPRQRSLSRVRVPWDSWPYFTVSDLRLPFRRLLRLAGSRWSYSTPPPHGSELSIIIGSRYIDSGRTTAQKHTRCPAMDICEQNKKHLLRHRFYCCVGVLWALPRNGSTLLLVEYLLRACLPSCSLGMDLYVTILFYADIKGRGCEILWVFTRVILNKCTVQCLCRR